MKPIDVVSLVSFFLQISAVGLMAYVTFNSLRAIRDWQKLLQGLHKRISKLETIIGYIASQAIRTPAGRKAYEFLATMPLDKIPDNDDQRRKLVKEMFDKQYAELIAGVTQRMNAETDPAMRARYAKILQEIQTADVLISSLDDTSSPEYVDTVKNTLEAAMRNLYNMKEDDEEDTP